MQNNTAKGSSTLHLSNGSSIDISNFEAKKPEVQLDPITGNFKMTKSADVGDAKAVVAGRQMGKSYSGNFTVSFQYEQVDYQERFEEKRKGMHDIVADGDGLTKEMVRDLVLTANKAVWQKSKDS